MIAFREDHVLAEIIDFYEEYVGATREMGGKSEKLDFQSPLPGPQSCYIRGTLVESFLVLDTFFMGDVVPHRPEQSHFRHSQGQWHPERAA